MSIESDIKAALAANVALDTLLPGGFYTMDDTRRLGINATTTPDAFDANGLLLKCLLIKARSQAPDGQIVDAGQQTQSERVVLEIWLYDEGANGWDDLETVEAAVYALLQEQEIGSVFGLRRFHRLKDTDPVLNRACFLRNDYEGRLLTT